MGTLRVTLDASNFDEMARIPFIKEIIFLSYILNTIRSAQRFVVFTAERPPSPATQSDMLFGLVAASSFVYEGMDKANRILQTLASHIPSELHADVAWLRAEVVSGDFYKNVLEKIRNEIAFHFDERIVSQHLQNAIKQYPPVFAEGTSTLIVDSSYVLANEIVSQHIFKLAGAEEKKEELVVQLVIRLRDYNLRLCNVLERIVAELISNYAHVES